MLKVSPLNLQQQLEVIQNAFEQAAGRWSGCVWYAPNGPKGVDLCNLRSNHTRLLADATSGEESAGWEAASLWLQTIENDAFLAEKHAAKAVELAQLGDLVGASDLIRLSVALEARYRKPQLWNELQQLIADAFHRQESAAM